MAAKRDKYGKAGAGREEVTAAPASPEGPTPRGQRQGRERLTIDGEAWIVDSIEEHSNATEWKTLHLVVRPAPPETLDDFWRSG